MKNKDLKIICFSLFIITGITLASEFHHRLTQSTELITSNLNKILQSSDPNQIHMYLLQIQISLDKIMENIPETADSNNKILVKNPVAIYPTESTNFFKIQNDIGVMITEVEQISLTSKDTSVYHVGMMDINNKTRHVKSNIMDAIPYMYNNPENIISNSIWLIGVLGMVEILIRKIHNNDF